MCQYYPQKVYKCKHTEGGGVLRYCEPARAEALKKKPQPPTPCCAIPEDVRTHLDEDCQMCKTEQELKEADEKAKLVEQSKAVEDSPKKRKMGWFGGRLGSRKA